MQEFASADQLCIEKAGECVELSMGTGTINMIKVWDQS